MPARGFKSLLRRNNTLLHIRPVGQAVKTPPFHGGITGSIPVRIIYSFIPEDYPSPAEGNGLENRQACKSVQEFESLILLRYLFYKVSLLFYYRGVEQLAARRAHNPKVVGSSPTSAIGPVV